MPRKRLNRDVTRARELREQMSLPEVLLWRLLRGEPGGVKFRRQHPLGAYVLDFYCAKAKVCIEIDGIAHEMGSRPERDEMRDAWLREQGIDFLRIPASDVLRSPDDVAEVVLRYCRD